MDSRNWPGLVLLGLGIVLVALALTAAGYGFTGWVMVAGIAAVLALVVGGFLVVLEHRRVKNSEGRELGEQRGH